MATMAVRSVMVTTMLTPASALAKAATAAKTIMDIGAATNSTATMRTGTKVASATMATKALTRSKARRDRTTNRWATMSPNKSLRSASSSASRRRKGRKSLKKR